MEPALKQRLTGAAVLVILAATVIIIDPWALGAIFLMGMMTLAFLTVGAQTDSDPEHPKIGRAHV